MWVVKIDRGRLERSGKGRGEGVRKGNGGEGEVEGQGEAGGEVKELGELRWEASSNHGVFAHWYGREIGEEAVFSVVEVERGEGEGWEGVLGGLEE